MLRITFEVSKALLYDVVVEKAVELPLSLMISL